MIVEGDRLMWLMQIARRVEQHAGGPWVNVFIGTHYASAYMTLRDLADGYYFRNGRLRVEVRVSDEIGYVLRPVDDRPDPRLTSVTAC